MNTHFVWHYTTEPHLPTIAQSSALIPTAQPFASAAAKILWLSRQQQWEPSATNIEWKRRDVFRRRARDHASSLSGPYRFGLPGSDSRLLPWPTVTRVAGIDVPEAMVMVANGICAGANPTDWLGTMSAVPLAELRFQAWDGEKWLDADLHEYELAARDGSAPGTQSIPLGGMDLAARRGTAHDLH